MALFRSCSVLASLKPYGRFQTGASGSSVSHFPIKLAAGIAGISLSRRPTTIVAVAKGPPEEEETPSKIPAWIVKDLNKRDLQLNLLIGDDSIGRSIVLSSKEDECYGVVIDTDESGENLRKARALLEKEHPEVTFSDEDIGWSKEEIKRLVLEYDLDKETETLDLLKS